MAGDRTPVIQGGTDGELIGNVGDRLKVDAQVSVVTQPVSSISNKFKVIYTSTPVNTTGATYTPIYSISNSGYFWGFRFLLNQDGGQVKLDVDDQTIFTDITSKNISDMGLNGVDFEGGFLHRAGAGSFYFTLTHPIRFQSSLQISVKRDNNGALTTNAQLIYLTIGE